MVSPVEFLRTIELLLVRGINLDGELCRSLTSYFHLDSKYMKNLGW